MILEKIVHNKRQLVAEGKKNYPLETFRKNLVPGDFLFRKAMAKTDWALIAECKLTSPAKGVLCTDYSILELAEMYTDSGATALSVHTDSHFSGQLTHIRDVKQVSSLPILRKDFIIDEYQIYESRLAGADAILLIAHLLSQKQLQEYLNIAEKLGMDCLVEVHSLEELERAQQTTAPLIGINNRNLQTFTTDVQNTFALLPYCDSNRLVISESGVSTRAEGEALRAIGVRGILVGEGLVKAQDIRTKTRELAMTNTMYGGKKHAK